MEERLGERPSVVGQAEQSGNPELVSAVREHMATPERVEQMQRLQAKVKKANKPLIQRIGDIFRRSS